MRYTEDHEWVSVEGDIATVGITEHAQDALGDIVFIDLPEVGAIFAQGDEVGVVESVKAASDIYAPISGEIIEVNEALDADNSLANSAPETEGWFMKIRISDESELDELLDKTAYDKLTG